MKVHCINILLFAHALNILVNNHTKTSITHHTRKIPSTRSLCECDLYMPNYDNDPQMKEVMQQFEDRSSQRFHEYDERMMEKRKQCKDQCDKEIQKIILKDKLEKELTEKFSTLDTDIQSDAVPTCVCEKSIADKVEKGCLRCGGVLGGGVAPGWGLLCGVGYAGWKVGAPVAAKAAAKVQAAFAAIEKGMEAAVDGLKIVNGLEMLLGGNIKDLVTPTNFYSPDALVAVVENVQKTKCVVPDASSGTFCNAFERVFDSAMKPKTVHAAKDGFAAYETEFASKTKIFTGKNLAAVEAANTSYQTTIIASIVVIVVIILIMVIIYLILRHRRKKKMKKKLQYIKLLEG
ncbi:rifin PIR protein,putative [Plasmodium sp. DRC-Itaito]|nr:rifin PIR protein,putative [Plasmodium sp. DRC-Itaito]